MESKCNIFLVYGDEEFLVEVKVAEIIESIKRNLEPQPEIEHLDYEEVSLEEIIQPLTSPSLFSTNQVIVVKNADLRKSSRLASYLESNFQEICPEGTYLVLITKSVDKRLKLVRKIANGGGLIEVSKPSYNGIKQWIKSVFRSMGKQVGDDVADILIDLKGDDLRAIHTEIEKIITYLGEKSVVERSDVEQVVGKSSRREVFDLIRLVVKRDLKPAIGIVSELLESGESPIGILYLISSEVRWLVQVRCFLEATSARWVKDMDYEAFQRQVFPAFKDWATKNGILPEDSLGLQRSYPIYMRFRESAEFTLPDLIAILEKIVTVNAGLVGSSIPPRVLLESLVSSVRR